MRPASLPALGTSSERRLAVGSAGYADPGPETAFLMSSVPKKRRAVPEGRHTALRGVTLRLILTPAHSLSPLMFCPPQTGYRRAAGTASPPFRCQGPPYRPCPTLDIPAAPHPYAPRRAKHDFFQRTPVSSLRRRGLRGFPFRLAVSRLSRGLGCLLRRRLRACRLRSRR